MTVARRVYSVALGYFMLTAALDPTIVIQTVVVEDEVTNGAGGAIIALSEPDAALADDATPLLCLLDQEFPE